MGKYRYKDIDGTIKEFECKADYVEAVCNVINRVGDSVSHPIKFLNYIFDLKEIDFIKPYNFIKLLECINISDFDRCGSFSVRLGSYSFEDCQKYFIGELCRQLCFNINPKNADVEEYYKKYKEKRRALIELILNTDWQ